MNTNTQKMDMLWYMCNEHLRSTIIILYLNRRRKKQVGKCASAQVRKKEEHSTPQIQFAPLEPICTTVRKRSTAQVRKSATAQN